MQEGNFFGELALLTDGLRTATAQAVDSVECYYLYKEDFLDLLDKKMLDQINKNLILQDSSIKLEDLNYISFLGKGKLGNVALVHNRKNLYAVKYIPTKLVQEKPAYKKYIMQEKMLLLSLSHPFLYKLVKTLKNENYFFFILEFVNGCTFDDYLTKRKSKRNINETRFYTAILLSMIDYLNSKNIAHRDIKPSNIMVEGNGYLKLIDFGTAVKIDNFTQTIIGTPHYMAPEVLYGKGYAFSCDYWSIGICIYEIYYGVYPFGNNSSDIMDVYNAIMHK